MCLIFIAVKATPEYPLIVAANRDEFFDRPALPIHHWEDSAIIAGKDLSAGGTWLGMTQQGRFAAITNYRNPHYSVAAPISRGSLVTDFLQALMPPEAYLEAIATTQHRYQGFNLLVGNPDNLWYFSNRAPQGGTQLTPGIYGLSNHLLDTPWPKVADGKQAFQAILNATHDSQHTLIDALFTLMNHRDVAADNRLPDTGIGLEMERYLSPRFIHTPSGHYGTRCSTVLLVGKAGNIAISEKTWDRHGNSDLQKDTVNLTFAPGVCSSQ